MAAVSKRADRWGYNQDLGIVFAAHHNNQSCPANVDQLVQTALARMGQQALPPQFERLILELKASTWDTLVTVDIPQLNTDIANRDGQIQILQNSLAQHNNQIAALQAQLAAIQQAPPPASAITADAIYGTAQPPLPDPPARQDIIINVPNANQGQYTLLMESLVDRIVDMIRHRVIDNLPGRLRTWLTIAEGRNRPSFLP
jgi:hypothetical protein